MILSFSFYPPVYDVSVFVVFCSVPYFTILPTPKILPSISWNQDTKTIWNSILNITFIFWLEFFTSNTLPNIRKGITPPIKSFTFVTIPKHRRRQKNERDEDYEWVSHLVSYKWFRRTENITELGLEYKEVGIYLVG